MIPRFCLRICAGRVACRHVSAPAFGRGMFTALAWTPCPLIRHSRYSQTKDQHLYTTTTVCKRDTGSRPSLDDVERISRGQAAKSRGTGSRRIPHRLNAEERQQYDIAKQKGFLTVKGTGYRKERKGSPLANIFRQWCDAQAKPCIVVEQGFGADAIDVVMIDVSTLRGTDAAQLQAPFIENAASSGFQESLQSHRIPFTIEAWQEFGISNNADSTEQQSQSALRNSSHTADSTGAQVYGAPDGSNVVQQPSVDRQAQESHEAPKAEEAGVSGSVPSQASLKKRVASSSPLAPIWQVAAQPIFFDADRPRAKDLAKSFVALQS